MITRFLFALLSATLLLAGSVFAYPLTASASQSGTASPTRSSGSGAADGGDTDGGESGTGVSIALTEVTPWLNGSGTLTVRGTVTNSTDAAISDPTLRLGMSTRNLDAEYRIEAWKTDPSMHRVIADLDDNGPDARNRSSADSDPVTAVDATFADRLSPGATGEFTMTVPADQLGLPRSSPNTSWGPRGLSVQLSDTSGALATGVAFTTWYPDPKFDQTRISFLAPVTLPGYTGDGLISAEELDRAIAADGPLTAVNGVLQTPGVAIALDPRIIASFEAAVAEPPPPGDDGDPATTEEPSAPATDAGTAPPEDDPAAQSPEEERAAEERRQRLDTWYRDFLATAGSHTVIALPFGDPDQASLAGKELDDLGRFAQEEKRLVKDVLPKARTDIGWPIAGTATRADLAALSAAGNKTIILDDVQQPPLSGIRESAHSQTRTNSDGSAMVETLISDSALTAASADVIAADRPAAAMSELVATTAAIQSEAPNRSRHLLVPLPRTTASAQWEQVVSTVAGSPWVDAANLDSLLSSDIEPRGLLQKAQDPERIATSTLEGLADIRARQTQFNSVFTDPDAANRRTDRALLGCTSVAWTLGGDSATCLDQAQQTSQAQLDSLYLEKGSSVLLVTGEKTTIPVTIVNDSGAEATLKLSMKPQTPQLRAQTTETVVVPPAETMRVDVPVEGLANADVPTRIEMISESGVVLPQSTSLLVRVRADWENIGTAVVGLALAAVFVIGLVKSVRRGRRKIPEQQLAAAVARAKNDNPERKGQ